MPATACPSFHGNVGVVGSAADGVPQYTARSATTGLSLSSLTENGVAGRSSGPLADTRSWSVQMLNRLRGPTVYVLVTGAPLSR